MSYNLKTCSNFITNKKIALYDPKGGRSTIYFKNDQKRKIQIIDVGCLKLSGKSCDYSLRIESQTIEIYIELKGCRVQDAFEQIENTIKQISSDVQKTQKKCFIVHTRYPSGTNIQIAKNKFNKNYNARLKPVKSPHEQDIEKLF